MSMQGYGEGFFYTPEDQAAQQQTRRQRAYAEALLRGSRREGQYGGLADAGEKIAGALIGRTADRKETDRATKMQAEFLKGLQSLRPDSQQQPMISNTPGSAPQMDSGVLEGEAPPPAQAQPQSMIDRIMANPQMAYTFGGDAIRQEMQTAAKRVTPMTPQETRAMGLRGIWGRDGAGNPVPIQQSDVKSPESEAQQIRIDQGKGLLTPEEEAQRIRIARETRPVLGGADANKPPAGYRWAPDGGLQAIPGGPADSTGKNSKATDTQRVTALYADRAREAENILSGQGGVEKEGTNLGQSSLAAVPGIGNYLVSNNYQKYEQAKRNFINAVLRKESGAVISKEEFDNAEKQYFPQPGNPRELIDQKRANRETAIEGLRRAAGTAMNQQGQPARAPSATRTIVRTGTRNGKRIVQYSDGAIEDAP